jgi:hypothetical protein
VLEVPVIVDGDEGCNQGIVPENGLELAWWHFQEPRTI